MKSNGITAEKAADRLEARASEYCHDAMYLGTDAEGAIHFWSRVHQTAIAFSDPGDTDPRVVELPVEETSSNTTLLQLTDWRDYVIDQRGEWEELRMSSSTGDQFVEAVR